MVRSVIRPAIALLAAFASVLSVGVRAQIGGQVPVRLVDLVEVSAHDEQIDIAVQFNCSMRYVTHLPASEGSELRIQLLPTGDCGTNRFSQIVPEVPPVSDDSGVLSSVRLESEVPGQVSLLLAFKSVQKYVIAQGTDPRGLRIRLLRQARARSKVLVSQSPESADHFAINLESQPKPFETAAIQLAHERLQLPVFVSEVLVGDEKWYRLRVGPVERRADAEKVLDRALRDYPRAWIARGDDAVTADVNAAAARAPLPAVGRIGTDPPLDHAEISTLLAQVRTAMSARDYPRAISLLTRLQ